MSDANQPGAVQETLRHLLDVEAGAAALVNDAQKEAQNRIAEAEKRFRAEFERIYAVRAAELDAGYQEKIGAVAEECRKMLDAYRAELDAMPENRAAFRVLLDRLLSGAGNGSGTGAS